jgi:hypothetical protein
MTERLDTLQFLEDAAAQLTRLARRDGVAPPTAAEMGRIAVALSAEAAQLRAELQLDSLAAKVANNNRRGLVGLAD